MKSPYLVAWEKLKKRLLPYPNVPLSADESKAITVIEEVIKDYERILKNGTNKKNTNI